MSRLELKFEPERAVRRFELIQGAGGRRRWTADDKAAIVAETLHPGAVVSAVARLHGLTPQQLFAWRREARRRCEGDETTQPAFVPAVVEAPAPPAPKRSRRRRPLAAASIELKISGVVIRIGHGARASTVAAVIRALKDVL
jgi:transposase